jgi:hypothetical protein
MVSLAPQRFKGVKHELPDFIMAPSAPGQKPHTVPPKYVLLLLQINSVKPAGATGAGGIRQNR